MRARAVRAAGRHRRRCCWRRGQHQGHVEGVGAEIAQRLTKIAWRRSIDRGVRASRSLRSPRPACGSTRAYSHPGRCGGHAPPGGRRQRARQEALQSEASGGGGSSSRSAATPPPRCRAALVQPEPGRRRQAGDLLAAAWPPESAPEQAAERRGDHFRIACASGAEPRSRSGTRARIGYAPSSLRRWPPGRGPRAARRTVVATIPSKARFAPQNPHGRPARSCLFGVADAVGVVIEPGAQARDERITQVGAHRDESAKRAPSRAAPVLRALDRSTVVLRTPAAAGNAPVRLPLARSARRRCGRRGGRCFCRRRPRGTRARRVLQDPCLDHVEVGAFGDECARVDRLDHLAR